ncbi:MAG: hypothetical protein LBM77_00920 [Spirochaetaceae bacterium]|jgi:GTPase SAR1 family protein|nr:hypothetical protein [Spirochaetaceae bacterium]
MEIIIAIIVIYLLWLLLKWFFTVALPFLLKAAGVASGVVAVIAGSIGAVGAFIFSIKNYIESINENKDAYATYVDKSKNKPMDVKRNYFFGPGYHQISQIVKNAWLKNKESIEKAWEWRDGGELPRKIVGTIYGIFFAICMGIIGSIWTILFSSIHAVSIFLFMFLFYIWFCYLWLLDRIILLIHSISSRCPNCKRHYIIPNFICPACGKIHSHLTPGPYGVLYRKCTCGTKIPCTFLNGRSRLEAHCPHCDASIASSSASQFGVIMVGGKSSGKTAFLAAFIHEYLDTLKKQSKLTYALQPEFEFEKLEDWFITGRAESTGDMNATMYSIIQTRTGSKFSHQLAIYDIAGETFEDQSAEMEQTHYRYCEAILLIVDPLCSPVVREAYTKTHNGQTPDNYSQSDFNNVVTGFINEFQRIGYIKTGKLSNVPVCVIITKSDIDVISQSLYLAKIQTNMQARDKVCYEYLSKIGLQDGLDNLEAQFSTIHYFPVSAIGHETTINNESYKPWGVMAPMSWILDNYDKETEKTNERKHGKFLLTCITFLFVSILYWGIIVGSMIAMAIPAGNSLVSFWEANKPLPTPAIEVCLFPEYGITKDDLALSIPILSRKNSSDNIYTINYNRDGIKGIITYAFDQVSGLYYVSGNFDFNVANSEVMMIFANSILDQIQSDGSVEVGRIETDVIQSFTFNTSELEQLGRLELKKKTKTTTVNEDFNQIEVRGYTLIFSYFSPMIIHRELIFNTNLVNNNERPMHAYGSIENPYDWSTHENQLKNSNITVEDYVKTAAGNIRHPSLEEVGWAKAMALEQILYDGTYTFSPRLLGTKGGRGAGGWLVKVVKQNDNFSLYISSSSNGKGSSSALSFGSPSTLILQDLDNPSKRYSAIKAPQWDSNTGAYIITFKDVTSKRLKYVETDPNPDWIIDNIILGTPDPK